MGLLDDCDHIFNAAGYCQWCGKSRLFAEAVQLRAEKLAAAARIVELSEENAKLREDRDEIISMRDAAEMHVIRLRAELATLKATAPYLVEQQEPATEQGQFIRHATAGEMLWNDAMEERMKRFVVYSQDDVEFFDTLPEAEACAVELIDSYSDDGEWDEAVSQIFIAELKYTVQQTNVVTPDMFDDSGSRELNGKFYEGNPDYWCNYELKEFGQ